MITHIVRDRFSKVAATRLKGMVSYAKSTGERPKWIPDKVWGQMEAYWKTEEAIKKSARASKARNSDRGGLGPHKHVGGPKSNTRIQREMSIEQGREVSIAEVFIKTHTRKDGTFVDEKAKQISEAYQKNVQSALAHAHASMASDGSSRSPVLTAAEENALFLESTVVDARGTPYGLGSLSERHGKRKKRALVGTSSSAIVALEEKLKEAETKLEEQVSQASQYKAQMDLMMKYMTEKDPSLPTWIQSQAIPPPTAGETIHPTTSQDDSSDSDSSDEDGDGDEEEEEQPEDNGLPA